MDIKKAMEKAKVVEKLVLDEGLDFSAAIEIAKEEKEVEALVIGSYTKGEGLCD